MFSDVLFAAGFALIFTGLAMLLLMLLGGASRSTGTLSIGGASGISATGPIPFLLIVLGVVLLLIAAGVIRLFPI